MGHAIGKKTGLAFLGCTTLAMVALCFAGLSLCHTGDNVGQFVLLFFVAPFAPGIASIAGLMMSHCFYKPPFVTFRNENSYGEG